MQAILLTDRGSLESSLDDEVSRKKSKVAKQGEEEAFEGEDMAEEEDAEEFSKSDNNGEGGSESDERVDKLKRNQKMDATKQKKGVKITKAFQKSHDSDFNLERKPTNRRSTLLRQ